MRMIVIDGNRDGTFTLYCYEGDDVVWEDSFGSEEAAKGYGNRYLDGEFVDGFEVRHG